MGRAERFGWGRRRRPATGRLAVLAATAVLAVPACRVPPRPGPTTTTTSPAGAAAWTSWGHDLANSHHQPAETAISPTTAARLAPRWSVVLKGDVSATPTVTGGVAYVPDWGGYLSAVDTADGRVRWQRPVSDWVSFGGVVSRTSPAVVGDDLVLGLTTKRSTNPLGGPPSGPYVPGDPYQGAWMVRVSRADGHLVWKTKVEEHRFAQITSNPVVHDGRVIVGISSNEWNLVGVSGAECCTFRGSVVSLDAADGTLRWQAYAIPASLAHPCDPHPRLETYASCGYSGAAVWSSPALDPDRGLVYVGTGQNYTVPDGVRPCITAARAGGRPDSDCAEPADRIDSILAIEVATGRIRWSRQLLPFDPWHMGCAITPGWLSCPGPYGPDNDIGSSPNLLTATVAGRRRDAVGAGQKSGTYWALDRDSGKVLWHTDVGPGSRLGGIEWGTAHDGERIYAPIGNIEGTPYTAPDGTALTFGSWAALDPATGRIIWQTQDPGAYLNAALASPSVANGVMFGASLSPRGDNFYALDAATGAILWRFPSGASSIASPAVVDGVVYWGTGYDRLAIGAVGGERLWAFSIDGR